MLRTSTTTVLKDYRSILSDFNEPVPYSKSLGCCALLEIFMVIAVRRHVASYTGLDLWVSSHVDINKIRSNPPVIVEDALAMIGL